VIRLPPYSPEFNPIEPCWSKMNERTREMLDQAIATAFSAVTASSARGWFQLCGYRPQSARVPRLFPTLSLHYIRLAIVAGKKFVGFWVIGELGPCSDGQLASDAVADICQVA
jgi:hypothetical protein